METAAKVRIRVAGELEKRWLDLNSIKGWLKGYKKIPREAQEEIAQTIRTLFAGYGLRPDLGHVVVLGDRPYVTREGLLYYARKNGLRKVKVKLVERGEDYCIVKATVTTKDGGKFEALGDASESNTTDIASPHLIRMAETRAINRALREAFPIGLCNYEELPDDEVQEKAPEHPRKITNKQFKYIWTLAREVLSDKSEEEVKDSLHKLMKEKFGKLSSKELTADEASRLIEILKTVKENTESTETN